MTATGQQGGPAWAISLRLLILCVLCEPLAAASYSGGDGTAGAPYLLGTPADVAKLAVTQADWDKWFVLAGDVDMQATPWGTTIGNKVLPFTGVFDGAGHRIQGFFINDTAQSAKALGLFGVLGAQAVVQHCRLTSPRVASGGSASMGVLAGQTMPGATVQQCSVEQGTVATPACDTAGLLIGDNAGTVRECYASGEVTALGFAGGLLGRNTGAVENCAASAVLASLKSGTGTGAGGLCGASVRGTFQFCFANSTSVTSQRPGGLVGYADLNSVFSNCVCNKVVLKAVAEGPADSLGTAWCEEESNLKSQTFFAGLGWDLTDIWLVDVNSGPRLRWLAGTGPVAVIRELPGPIGCDPATGLATITLDGSLSSDPAGNTLRYSWLCLTAEGKATNITIESVPSPSVRLPVGTYRIQLIVSTATAQSEPATITITITAEVVNLPPTAHIEGPTDVVQPDATTGLAKVGLDGSRSTDPEKHVLTYKWNCFAADGTPLGTVIEAVERPSVLLPVGVYRIELRVNDGTADSDPDWITITVAFLAANTPPTAFCPEPPGPIRPDPATGFARVALEASQSSDPDQDTLKFSWKCLTAAGEATGVTIPSVPDPVVQLRAGQYRIELTVNDGQADSVPVFVLVTVNTPPTAEAGPPQEVYDDGSGACQVKLDGSQSFDPEAGKGQTLVYSWTCATANPGSASGPTPALVFPIGVHKVVLVVSDGLESCEDTVEITVRCTTAAARAAASPGTIGRTSTIPDVVFYLLLPTGRTVSDVDLQAPLILDRSGATLPLTRDFSYSHKKMTVVAYTTRQKVLDLVGTTNGPVRMSLRVRLKTGEVVSAPITLEITAGPGPDWSVVRADRAYYYLDSRIWK